MRDGQQKGESNGGFQRIRSGHRNGMTRVRFNKKDVIEIG